ncbi:MAG: SDR family oxidoreductase [Planctomycetota bacterium]
MVGEETFTAGQPAPFPLPLLVTGIAGVAGYNAFRFFQQQYPGQVIGTRRVDNWRLKGDGIEPCDTHDRVALGRLLERYPFRAVLNCEGLCKLKSCEYDHQLARQVNVAGTANLLEQLAPQARLVHLSVDLVYSGRDGGQYREDEPTDPVTVYGAMMVAAEELVARQRPDASILRISLPMGISFNGHAGAIDWIQSRFKQAKPATLFYDEVRTPTYTDCLNRVFAAMLQRPLAGIYHVGGPRRLTLYQIGQIVNRVGGYDPTHLQGCWRHQAGPVPPRAGDVTMDSSKLAAALGYQPLDPWPRHQELVPDHAQWHHDRGSDRPGSPAKLADLLYRNPLDSGGVW